MPCYVVNPPTLIPKKPNKRREEKRREDKKNLNIEE